MQTHPDHATDIVILFALGKSNVNSAELRRKRRQLPYDVREAVLQALYAQWQAYRDTEVEAFDAADTASPRIMDCAMCGHSGRRHHWCTVCADNWICTECWLQEGQETPCLPCRIRATRDRHLHFEAAARAALDAHSADRICIMLDLGLTPQCSRDAVGVFLTMPATGQRFVRQLLHEQVVRDREAPCTASRSRSRSPRGSTPE